MSDAAQRSSRPLYRLVDNSPTIQEVSYEIREGGKVCLRELQPQAMLFIGATLESLIDDWDAELSWRLSDPRALSTTYKTRSTWLAVAKATVCEAAVDYGLLSVMARGPTAVLRRKMGVGSLSVLANAQLCRAEVCIAGFSIGLGLDTSSSFSI